MYFRTQRSFSLTKNQINRSNEEGNTYITLISNYFSPFDVKKQGHVVFEVEKLIECGRRF